MTEYFGQYTPNWHRTRYAPRASQKSFCCVSCPSSPNASVYVVPTVGCHLWETNTISGSIALQGPTWSSAEFLKKNEKSGCNGLEADSVEQLRTKLRDMLECPVCYEMLRPPVLQCLNGHSLCGKCTARLSSGPCPICRGKLEGSRNLVAEELCHQMWYPCRYKRCSQSFLLRDLEPHEAGCTFRQYCCPLNATWRSDGSVIPCLWTMPRCEALCHARRQHGTQVWRGRKHHVSDYNFTSHYQRLYLISAYDELFLWCGQYIPSEQKFFGALKFEGPLIKAEGYKYTFKLSKSFGRDTLKITCAVQTAPFEDVMKRDGYCVMLDSKTIKRFSDGDKVSFFLKIDSEVDRKK